MNSRQKITICVAIAAWLVVLLFPPFQLAFGGGGIMNLGYGFLFSPPRNGIATVNAALLLIELLSVSAVATAFWFITKHSVEPIRVQLSDVTKLRWRKTIRLIAVLVGLLIAMSITIALTGRTPFTGRQVSISSNEVQPSYSVPTLQSGLNPALSKFDAEQAAIAQVELAHPGWQNLVRTTDFINWMKRQPASVQSLANSPMPADAIKMLDLYRHDQDSQVR